MARDFDPGVLRSAGAALFALRLRVVVIFGIVLGMAGPGNAQMSGLSFDTGQPAGSAILVIDFERLFSESAFGARIASEIESEGTVLAAENRRIEEELIEEERSLTERRATLPPAEFRALADAFDEKVQRLRDAQDAKARALAARGDTARRRLLVAVQPVLDRIMRDRGAAAILELRAVFAARDDIDITAQAIARLNDRIGDGADLPSPATGATTEPGEGAVIPGVDLSPDPATPEAGAAEPALPQP